MRWVTRAMLLGALLVTGCGEGGGAPIELYHLEAQVRGPVADGEVTCAATVALCPYADDESSARAYDVDGEPALTEDDFRTERARAVLDANSGQPAVILDLTDEGTAKFEAFTRELSRTGHARGEIQHIAVVVGDDLVSWPSLDHELFPNGIDGDGGVLIAVDRLTHARRLARELRGESE